ncbi:calcium/sodium antiporter [Ostreiculturibacter nitratireducens]|uniref:calcium/sodium antiporter n=1 Tax=Ostreiculturibacter nitratireducens TaxID=3075226 RepID=UPI0031B63440
MDFVWALAGLAILVAAGDVLVRGAVNLSLKLGIPALIVSLTVVAFGTSAPELLISVFAVIEGAPGIALGNVVGSNIANVLLVLGLPALIAPIITRDYDTRKSFLTMLAATALFMILCFSGPIRWPHALALLAGLALMLGDAIRGALRERAAARVTLDETLDQVDPAAHWGRTLGYIAVGLVGLPLGADLLVDGASGIARAAGISETVIGLTLVAIGTSAPELATSVMAAWKGRADVALGNVIGSNMFNLLGIIGVAGLVGPIPVGAEMTSRDLWVMLAAALLLAPFVFYGWRIGRRWGLGLTGAYGAYVVMLLG